MRWMPYISIYRKLINPTKDKLRMALNLKIFAVFQTEHIRMPLSNTVKHSKNLSLIHIKYIMIEVL